MAGAFPNEVISMLEAWMPCSDNSSAGRAEDCRVTWLSLGRWFNSSLSEFFFIFWKVAKLLKVFANGHGNARIGCFNFTTSSRQEDGTDTRNYVLQLI